ncbi:hypothetical protein MPNT_20122 [Candidatus Methylacidithermus pantelleriae]|uniref:Uncharacterized protein n=1 Tax=Candidatus Methylacidithermus pantelleriae TaxID=2744239 RepID=A0A8J2BMG8_9BACT|nr:hypothetical protein MPNT_20122 [Candidatus Methylacidithermus pantelleriae]
MRPRPWSLLELVRLAKGKIDPQRGQGFFLPPDGPRGRRERPLEKGKKGDVLSEAGAVGPILSKNGKGLHLPEGIFERIAFLGRTLGQKNGALGLRLIARLSVFRDHARVRAGSRTPRR